MSEKLIYRSGITNTDWNMITSLEKNDGYVAINDTLKLTIEGDNIHDIIESIKEAEQLLMKDLLEDYMSSIHQENDDVHNQF